MASQKDYLLYVLEQISDDNVTYRQMMGEYLLYYKNFLFGGIYDNRLLVKVTAENGNYGLPTVIPYKNAKPMYEIQEPENHDLLLSIIHDTVNSLRR